MLRAPSAGLALLRRVPQTRYPTLNLLAVGIMLGLLALYVPIGAVARSTQRLPPPRLNTGPWRRRRAATEIFAPTVNNLEYSFATDLGFYIGEGRRAWPRPRATRVTRRHTRPEPARGAVCRPG
jgi:hypothetical protein